MRAGRKYEDTVIPLTPTHVRGRKKPILIHDFLYEDNVD